MAFNGSAPRRAPRGQTAHAVLDLADSLLLGAFVGVGNYSGVRRKWQATQSKCDAKGTCRNSASVDSELQR